MCLLRQKRKIKKMDITESIQVLSINIKSMLPIWKELYAITQRSKRNFPLECKFQDILVSENDEGFIRLIATDKSSLICVTDKQRASEKTDGSIAPFVNESAYRFLSPPGRFGVL